LVVVGEERRLAGTLVGKKVVAALAQRVPEQDRALDRVDSILPGVLHQVLRSERARRRRVTRPLGKRLLDLFGPRLPRFAQAPVEDGADAARDVERPIEGLM